LYCLLYYKHSNYSYFESGITVDINGQDVTLRSFEDICEALEGLTTFGELRFAVESILQEALGFVPMNNEFFSCIAEALGIPIVVPIPG
jgi:hypothetical protein